MTENLALWNALAKTDPAHTKSFTRSGGFKGTAIKPIWIVRRLTEQFGPCGVGWGVCAPPSFQVVPCEGEVLVFCTVCAWHGSRDNVLWGVGGDKVQAKNRNGVFCDDEAFKKAFTDAVGNAFKHIGVGADVHMGLFDDAKYVAAARRESDARAASKPDNAAPAPETGGTETPAPKRSQSYEMMADAIHRCETVEALNKWADDNAKALAKFDADEANGLRREWNARKKAIEQVAMMAAG